jgi:hypothetical protein
MKEALVYTIANHMKKCFLNWNKDTVEDTLIFRHLFELSNGKIDLKESNEDLSDSASLMRSKKKYSNSNTKKSYKKSTSNTNRGHKRY